MSAINVDLQLNQVRAHCVFGGPCKVGILKSTNHIYQYRKQLAFLVALRCIRVTGVQVLIRVIRRIGRVAYYICLLNRNIARCHRFKSCILRHFQMWRQFSWQNTGFQIRRSQVRFLVFMPLSHLRLVLLRIYTYSKQFDSARVSEWFESILGHQIRPIVYQKTPNV